MTHLFIHLVYVPSVLPTNTAGDFKYAAGTLYVLFCHNTVTWPATTKINDIRITFLDYS